MSVEEMKAALKDIEIEINFLNEKRSALRMSITLAQSKFNIGDRVTHDGTTNVWQITQIRPSYVNEPRYFGAKIKKDGTPGAVTSEIYTWSSSPLRLA